MMKVRILTLVPLFCMLLAGCSGGEERYALSAERIQADTEYLCLEIGDRPTGTEKEQKACDWLQEQLEAVGFSLDAGTLERVPFQGFKEMTSENLIAVCNRDSEGPILCVMAHYDTVEGTPGARDNTSSVATLLELARYLGTEQPELNAQVRLLFLGSEENGYHGASAYVGGLSQEELARHQVAFNMENSAASPNPGAVLVCGIDYPNIFLEAVENQASVLVSQAYQTLYKGAPPPTVYLGYSDHLVFQQAGIDSVNVNWRTLKDGKPTVPEQYHKATDTPEGMDFSTAVVTGNCILEAIWKAAPKN